MEAIVVLALLGIGAIAGLSWGVSRAVRRRPVGRDDTRRVGDEGAGPSPAAAARRAEGTAAWTRMGGGM